MLPAELSLQGRAAHGTRGSVEVGRREQQLSSSLDIVGGLPILLVTHCEQNELEYFLPPLLVMLLYL